MMRQKAMLDAAWYVQPMSEDKGWVILAITENVNQCGGVTDDTVAVLAHESVARRMAYDHNKVLEMRHAKP